MRHLVLFSLLALGQAAAVTFPRAEIASAGIAATVCLPDAKAGYCRGTRFDWSGAVARLPCDGRESQFYQLP